MEVIAIISRKGGVGKTATAHALGAGLMRKGYKVLFIDLDSQGNLSYTLKADAKKSNSLELLTGGKASRLIQHTEQGDIIPATEELAGADQELTGKRKEYLLKDALQGLQYDYVVIDTPAALGSLTVNALTASECAIVPVQAEIYSLQGIGQLMRTVETVKKYCNKGLYIKGILITRYNGRAILSKDMQANLQEIAEQMQTRLYDKPIRECISIKEAQACRQDIFTYAPKSNAAADYLAFIEEFLR